MLHQVGLTTLVALLAGRWHRDREEGGSLLSLVKVTNEVVHIQRKETDTYGLEAKRASKSSIHRQVASLRCITSYLRLKI
ncbi:hypothetical protein TNCV_4473031 [Trichonephila clavipes]|uniref:Uncharacterized protein n=1 Tax=Trichonephila clavipes TaxID=2585209 RepID=A0A8X6SH37_TRICX|nr:hypothetical protein TNCV_4473031 [Trichonephila clavipes]